MKKISHHLKRKEVTIFFSLIAFLFGFLFITKTMTGNIIIDDQTKATSIIGIILIICGIIIGAYTIKSK